MGREIDRENLTALVDAYRNDPRKLVEEILIAGFGSEQHEWQCPACGATTRARMADHECAHGMVLKDASGNILNADGTVLIYRNPNDDPNYIGLFTITPEDVHFEPNPNREKTE